MGQILVHRSGQLSNVTTEPSYPYLVKIIEKTIFRAAKNGNPERVTIELISLNFKREKALTLCII